MFTHHSRIQTGRSKGRHWIHHCTPWVLLPLLAALSATPALAKPSAAKGKAISPMCAACHGNKGHAVNSSYPNLTGQNYQYLVTQLNRFKNGERKNATMHSMASGLSEQQIKDIAAYFSSIHRGCHGNAGPHNHG